MDAPGARFPDSRRESACAHLPKPEGSVADQGPGPETEDQGSRAQRSVAAYSGGTVWDLHPLRVAAGDCVGLSMRIVGFSTRGAPSALWRTVQGRSIAGLPLTVVFS